MSAARLSFHVAYGPAGLIDVMEIPAPGHIVFMVTGENGENAYSSSFGWRVLDVSQRV
jgi:hypothetical protein